MTGVVFLVLLAALPSLCVADLSTAPITTDWIPKVSRKMVKFAESQTGALQLVKAYDERLNFTQIQIDGVAQLHLLTQAAGDRLKMCREILERNKAEIEASHAQGPTGGAPASDCCDNLGQLEYDPRFLQQIVNDSCATFTAGTGDNTVRPHVYDTMKSNIHEMSGVTWQYYGAKEGEYHQFPKSDRSCEGNGHRFRNWYVSAASPKKKNVVIVMDVSGSMREPHGVPEEQNRLNLAKQAALTVLDTLTPRDWAGVVSFSARAKAPEGCLGDSLGEANPTNIGIMKDFINQRVPETITVYAEGFKKAFNMFFESKNKKPEQFEDCQNIIIFLTDGQPTDTYFTLDDIVKGQDLMERSVHIFTYGLGANLQWANSGWYNDPSRPWVQLPALDFLATIADQNNRQIPGAVEWTNRYCENGMYGSCFSANRDPQGVGPWGRTEYIDDNEGDKLKTIMGSYYDFFPFSSDPAPTYSVPTNDEHLGLVINAALPTIDTAGTFFGVTAVDISMDIVFREIANFNIGKYSYAFLVDREDGRVLIHRNLPKPMEWKSEPTFLGLEAMEEALRSRERTKILNGDSGDYYTMVKQKNTGDLYHRLDLLYMNNATGDTQFCSLYGEYATPDESTVKARLSMLSFAIWRLLSGALFTVLICIATILYLILLNKNFPPEAFVDPVNYLGTSETFDDVVDIELFINDVAGFAANPGLLDGVRTDAILSAEIEQYWRENGQESVWRYFGTENGVFRIFPGIITDKRYDPTRQTWYARALSRPGDYTFSRPVPSPFGGGNMVTISRVIYHTKTNEVLGVIAADITEKYYYSMLYSEVPECLSDEYDCFLLDDSGYFMESLDNTTIYYLSTFNNNTRDMEHDHLTHRFPWLAKTLIVRGEYLRSEWCNNYATQKSQLFYDTTGFIGLEVTTGPPCYQFALHPINSTNTFILTLHNRHTYNCDDRPIIVGGNQIYRMRFIVFLMLLTALPILCFADLSTAPITTDWIPRVSRKMVKFAESQTGALQLGKAYDEKLNFTEIQIDGKAQLHLLTQAAGDRLKKCREILERNKAEIEASHAQGPTGGAPASDCCDNLGQLEYDPRFLQQIINDSCATFTAGNGDNTVRPNVYDIMKSNIHEMSGVTWQYYGAKEGEYHQFPKNDRSCEGNDHRFRNWYVSAASPKKKNVVIVMDVSGSMREPPGPEEQNRLNLAKQAALTVLDTLTPRDWGGVVSFSARAETPEGCLGDSLGEANPTNIGIMKDFINQRVPETITMYGVGFRKAFDMFAEARNKKPEQFEDCYNIIIFLSDGSPTDKDFALNAITQGQELMDRSVYIFTYGLGANLMWASSQWAPDPNNQYVYLPALDFLRTIADQNNHQIPGAVEWTNAYCTTEQNYGLCFSQNRDPQGVGPSGRMEYIDDGQGDKLKTIMGSYYDFFPFSSDPEPTYSVPNNDEHLGKLLLFNGNRAMLDMYHLSDDELN
uniref:VWFA domain-containing protein n=1 Tax=Branchiostoma floridae TaxID=7739 RepID=C3XQR7_BRAFL|eukprot:XP_002613634.1 hypothetical protein BRAFLDRAFT_93675 [Branchiostoma floridae]